MTNLEKGRFAWRQLGDVQDQVDHPGSLEVLQIATISFE